MIKPAEPKVPPVAHELAQLRAQLLGAQAAQQQLEQQLATSQAGLAEFASTVSHDLRANLRHINAFAALLREELGPLASADVKSFLDKLSDSARQMGVQLEGLMALTQIDRASLHMEPVQSAELINRLRMSLTAEMAGRSVDWQVADDFPKVLADAGMLEQIWSQLLSNALKFSAQRADARIRIGWEKSSATKSVNFFIEDNGVGFDPRSQDQLFKAFKRLHSSQEFPGIGMGLAMVRKLVGRQGGQVWIEGKLAQGCRTSFSLLLTS
jgi:light-regulated signal transduction histidine kinase (bacteriophytochrome)